MRGLARGQTGYATAATRSSPRALALEPLLVERLPKVSIRNLTLGGDRPVVVVRQPLRLRQLDKKKFFATESTVAEHSSTQRFQTGSVGKPQLKEISRSSPQVR